MDPSHPLFPDLLELLEAAIREHHALYPTLPVKGEHFEAILHNALAAHGVPHSWVPGSHAIGTDVTLFNAVHSLRTSLKAGISDSTILSFSGSRLGSHRGDISAMIGHLNDTRDDIYLVLARTPGNDPHSHTYQLFTFTHAMLVYGTPSEWAQSVNANGYTTWKRVQGWLTVEIRESMSFQAWHEIALAAAGLSPVWQGTIAARPRLVHGTFRYQKTSDVDHRLLDALSQHPGLAEDELADLCGLSRQSVRVRTARLHRGGYVIRRKPTRASRPRWHLSAVRPTDPRAARSLPRCPAEPESPRKASTVRFTEGDASLLASIAALRSPTLGSLAEESGRSEETLSTRLNLLRRAGLVAFRKSGRQKVWRATPAGKEASVGAAYALRVARNACEAEAPAHAFPLPEAQAQVFAALQDGVSVGESDLSEALAMGRAQVAESLRALRSAGLAVHHRARTFPGVWVWSARPGR